MRERVFEAMMGMLLIVVILGFVCLLFYALINIPPKSCDNYTSQQYKDGDVPVRCIQ